MSQCVIVVDDHTPRSHHIELGLRNAGYDVHLLKIESIPDLQNFVDVFHPAYVVFNDEVIIDITALVDRGEYAFH